MALPAGMLIEVRNGGSDANGGGFNPANANFATDLTTDTNTGNTASPVVSSASYNFVAGDVGAWVYIKAGTNWIFGWYQIASVASNKATLSAAIGAAYLSTDGRAVTNRNKPIRISTVAGCATVGTPTGGTWGIDYSQQAAAEISFTDMVIDGTTNTKFTSAANPVGKNMIGNIVNVTSGTGFTVQRVEIVSTVTTTATCDKSLGTLSSTGGNGALGGGLASIGMAGGIHVAGNKIFYKYHATNYVIASTSANIATGKLTLTGDSTTITAVIGYDMTRTVYNKDANRPRTEVAASGVTSIDIMAATVAYSGVEFRNLIVDGLAKTSVNGIRITNGGTHGTMIRCAAFNVFDALSGAQGYLNCYVDTSTNVGIGGQHPSVAIGCYGRNNAYSFYYTRAVFCIAHHASTGTGFYGGAYTNCIGYKCSNAFLVDYTRGLPQTNCVAVQNATYGWSGAESANIPLINCAGYSNTSGHFHADIAAGAIVQDFIELTANPFVDPDNGDFRLNNTPGGGPLLRAAGFPSVFPPGADETLSYLDRGASQHYEPTNAEVAAAIWGYADRTLTG